MLGFFEVSALLLALIHQIEWKEISANFDKNSPRVHHHSLRYRCGGSNF